MRAKRIPRSSDVSQQQRYGLGGKKKKGQVTSPQVYATTVRRSTACLRTWLTRIGKEKGWIRIPFVAVLRRQAGKLRGERHFY